MRRCSRVGTLRIPACPCFEEPCDSVVFQSFYLLCYSPHMHFPTKISINIEVSLQLLLYSAIGSLSNAVVAHIRQS